MIELKELTLGYGQRTLLETVNARITGGQLVALLGRNGTGKSTLLRAMMGLEKPQSGEITLQGKNIASSNVLRKASIRLWGSLLINPTVSVRRIF